MIIAIHGRSARLNEVQITALLVAFVAFLIAFRAYRRNVAEQREEEAHERKKSEGVSYDTGRDETQWRRAYSRG